MKVKTKIINVVEAGYKCQVCGIEIVVFGSDPVPVACPCGDTNIQLVWKDQIEHTMKITSLL